MITIKDIAKRAGVSVAAVSYALNGKDGISKKKADRILKIAEETGYVPNALAQGLLKNKTGVIGLVVPDISNAYITNFLRQLEEQARKHKLFLMIGSTSNNFETEKEIINKFISKKVDGLIISPGNYYDENSYFELTEYINKRKTPFVMVNLTFPNIKCNYIVVDLEKGEYKITKYLLEKGFNDIVFVGGSQEHYYSAVRYNGFKRALKEYNVKSVDNEYIECGNSYNYNDGIEASKMIIKRKKLPHAIVAVNDLVAHGIIKGLEDNGISVPNDISVAGFDNIELPVSSKIKLTTVDIPLRKMAELCIDAIINDDNTQMFSQYLITPEIFEGESVK